ncbi:MAG: hypothetical protein AB7I27_07070 [Bacteriovoracaceae bacterium]
MENNLTLDEIENWIKIVTTEFYEIVYQDAWFKEIFKVIKQDQITSQQIDFMVGAFGGPQRFSGRMPGNAHPHIFIDEEMWEYREALLKQAFAKVNCPEFIQTKWLKIDNAFKRQIVMKSVDECQKRFFTDEIIVVPNPFKKSA